MPFTVTTGYWRREMDPTEGSVWRTITDDFETLAEAEAFVRLQKKLDAQLQKRASLTLSGPGEYTITEKQGEVA